MLLLILTILAGIVFGISMALYDGNVKMCLADIVSNFFGGTETKYVLIMGVSEDISAELTDTIMLAGYNPDTGKAFLVSIPRDTFIGNSKYSAKANDKINAQYSKDVNKTIKSVEELTGVDIDNYIVVKTSMLVEIVDQIGGVEFDVPIQMDYDDPTQDLHIHLKKGIQMIDGDKAEQLLRFRHNNNGSSYPASYGDNDSGRMRTQREFMKATAEQTLKFGNITKINGIVKAVFDNLETDLSTKEILAYVPKLAVFDTKNLEMIEMPGTNKKLNGLYFFLADEEKTKKVVSDMIENMNLK